MARVLIIEDDAAMLRLLARALSDAGHEVIEAANGREGIRLFRNQAPAVVVTDIIMPEQEGVQTIRDIRDSGSRAAIVAISGGGMGAAALYLRIAEELGADAVLAKPFRPDELVEVVNGLLARGRPVEDA